jgi:RNA polymerase sigma-70 factor (ECF subfamily)
METRMPEVEPAVIAAAQRGEPAAHARLYELYAPMVYTLARRMLASTAPAEDVLQETFVEVIRKIDSYRGEAGVGFWVRRIAVNKCLMHLRSGWISRRVDITVPERPCPRQDGENAVQQIALARALSHLSDVSRAVVWLHDVEGYTHKEIGQLMDRTTSFSKSQLARAHERLRVLLEEHASEDGTQVCTPALKTC